MSSSSSSSSALEDPTTGPSLDVALVNLYSRFHFRCREPSCRSKLSFEDLKAHLDDWLAGAKQIPPSFSLSVICCTKCRRSTCIGCGKQANSTDMTFTPFGVVDHCCTLGRLIGVWVILARWDIEELQPLESPIKVTPKVEGSKSAKSTGVGYGGPSSYEIFGEYDPDDLEEFEELMSAGLIDMHYSLSAVETPNDDQEYEHPDSLMAQLLTLSVAFLKPSTSGQLDDTFSQDVLAFLRNSALFDAVTTLMRSDSITEMTRRQQVYEAAFEFIGAIVRHPELRVIITEPRLIKKESPGLHALSRETRAIHGGRVIHDVSASLYECSKNTYDQAQVYLRLAFQSAQDPKKASVRLCNALIELYTDMQRLSAPPAQLSTLEAGDPWVKYAEQNRVNFTDDVLFIHSFTSVKNSKGADSARGQLSTIGKEIANMTTSLPVGIFLKVADSRSDIMKALIVGPEGSPYAGGLFPFDIFLDPNYPVTPPKVQFVLPGSETSMNPNLHPGGTVCLSLLNTWSGTPRERWQPNKSTILSVLVSIQAMILGAPLPWLNEPGFENQNNNPRAHEYNLQVQCKTVKYAMLGWLKKPWGVDKVWTEVAEMYWKCNGAKVLQTVQEWKLTNPLLTSFNIKALHTHAHQFVLPTGKKPKLKATAREVENLVDKLAEGLGLKAPEAPPDPVPATSGKGPSKRSIGGSSGSKAKRLKNKDSEASAAAGGDIWSYTGLHDMKSIRSACEEFGCCPARSIRDSIERLEQFVNNKNLRKTSTAAKWGEVSTDSVPNHHEDEDDWPVSH